MTLCSLCVGLYTFLPLPILYGVKHTNGGSGQGRGVLAHTSFNTIATECILQVGGGNAMIMKIGSFHKSVDVNKYLVKANLLVKAKANLWELVAGAERAC